MKIRKIADIVVYVLVVMLIVQFALFPLTAFTAEKPETLTIAFTHDLHDHFLPLRKEQNGTVLESGGWARLAGAIARERDAVQDLLLLDAGDYSMGTMFQMLYQKESPGLILMGQMGYDVITIGNHEFDFLPGGLAQHLQNALGSNKPLPEIVAANILFPETVENDLLQLQEAFSAYPVKQYTVLEKGGFRIGVFGLMGKEADSNAPMAGVHFSDQLEAARQMVAVLNDVEQVDMVVCLSHSGTHSDSSQSEDGQLAEQVSGIDVIISGHSHTRLEEPLIYGDTVVVSAGQYGDALGVLKMSRNQESWLLSDYKLIDLDKMVPIDEEILQQVGMYSGMINNEFLAPLGMELGTVLANADFSFTPYQLIGAEHREEPLGNLIADAYRHAVAAAEGQDYEEVAVAVAPSGVIRGSFAKGPVTAYDAFVVSSLGTGPDGQSGFPLLSVYLSGQELKAVCEIDASITPLMSSAQLYMSGISYTFNPYRLPFNKVTEAALIRADGTMEDIEDDQLYRVVAGLYSAQMLSVVGEKSFGLLSVVPKTKEGTPVEDYFEQIIYQGEGSKRTELKEWIALADYLESFPEQEGVPVIPLRYSQTEGRKIITADNSLFAVLANPNQLATRIYWAAAAVIVLVVWITSIIWRRKRKKHVA